MKEQTLTPEQIFVKALDESDINAGMTYIDDSLHPVIELVVECMEQYAELRIQQEREKWKEILEKEVVKACIETSNDLEGTYLSNHSIYKYAKEYYETEVKPRIDK